MSEELNPTAPAEQAGEPSFAADGAVTLDGVTFPPTQPAEGAPAAEAASSEPAPEPPAPAQTAPEPPAADPYTPVRLANGDLELRLGSDEVFRGRNEMELLANVAKGKLEATRYIQELKSRVPEPPQAAPAAPATAEPAPDPGMMAVWDYMAPGAGFKTGAEMIAALQGLQQMQMGYGEMQIARQQEQAAAQFLQSTPDFVRTEGNIHKLGEIMDKMNLAATPENFSFAHDALKSRGLYEAAPAAPPASAQPRQADGRFAPPTPNPLPPSGSAPPTTGAGTPSPADLYAMPYEQLEAILTAAGRN